MKKILVFGASERIQDKIDKYLNMDELEIVGYIDNNAALWGEKVNGKDIFSPKHIQFNNSYDAILLGSVYYAPLMRKQILDINDYYKDKNFMFFDEESLKEAFYDPNLFISMDRMKWIYKEPEKMESIFIRVCKQLPEMAEVGGYSILSEQYSNGWWRGVGKLIAHAGGGYVNGKKLEYTNSKEAFYESYANGFKYIEADIMETTDGKLVACAWFLPYYDGEQATYNQFLESCKIRNYTPMDFTDLINFIDKYSDVHIVLDIKSRTIEHYKHMLEKIVSMVKDEYKKEYILQRFVVQVHEVRTLNIAKTIYPFKDITLTLYRTHWDKLLRPNELAKMCVENKIPIVTMGFEKMNYEYLRFFIAHNIRICIHPVDTLADLKKGESIGVDSFITNWLLPRNILKN
ncbi:hypothetical protein [Clostridium thermarum]|uniref:hypothetical protein n=1 Tax=Clostridium thermarum TaxID=1716543 RepID=UPI001121BFEE|nr:hypothetical protein [Clostridium thermarum]